MGTQALLDITCSSSLGKELESLEPVDVFLVEEHVSDGDDLLVDLVRVASEDDALGGDSVCVDRVEGAGADEFGGGCGVDIGEGGVGGLEEESGDGTELDGTGEGNEGGAPGLEEFLEFVDVVGGVSGLGIEWVDEEGAGSGGEDERFFGFDGGVKVAAGGERVVDDGELVLVAEERVYGEWLGGIVGDGDAAWGVAEEDLDAGSGWDTSNEGLAENLVLGSLVVAYPEETVVFLWHVWLVFLGVPRAGSQTSETSVLGQTFPRKCIWMKLNFIWEFEILLSILLSVAELLNPRIVLACQWVE